jgi:hypothetical protein
MYAKTEAYFPTMETILASIIISAKGTQLLLSLSVYDTITHTQRERERTERGEVREREREVNFM